MANTWTSLLELVYPVGAVYQSWNTTSPATLFGGTWLQLTDRFLYASSTPGATGGKSNHSHSLDSDSNKQSWANIDFLFSGNWCNVGYRTMNEVISDGGSFSANEYKAWYSSSINASSETAWHGITLGGRTQENSVTLYPPYLTCCIWYRTA